MNSKKLNKKKIKGRNNCLVDDDKKIRKEENEKKDTIENKEIENDTKKKINRKSKCKHEEGMEEFANNGLKNKIKKEDDERKIEGRRI